MIFVISWDMYFLLQPPFIFLLMCHNRFLTVNMLLEDVWNQKVYYCGSPIDGARML